LLGAAVLMSSADGPPADVLELVRACRGACMGNQVQRPVYVAVLAALDAVRGKHARARRRFDDAASIAGRAGLVDCVLDVYRLAARSYPAGSRERPMYEWLERTLAARIAAAPGLSTKQLAEGAFAPPIEVPSARDFTPSALPPRAEPS
jgi:hypothetical protein